MHKKSKPRASTDPPDHAGTSVDGTMLRVTQAHDAAFHLSAIVESSHDAIISKNLDGSIVSWNTGAQRIFGYQAEEVIGRNISILIPPERAHEEQRILQQIANGERIEHYQTVRRRKDGSSVDISLTVSPIRDAGGRIVGASKIARDISEQVRAQDLLRQSEERFRVTLTSIGDALISTDHQARVAFMNAVAERLTGWTRQEAVGHPLTQCFKIVNELTRQPVEDPVTRVLREGTVVALGNHTVLMAKDGTERPIDDSAAPIRNATGDVIGVVLVFRDVTERRALEREIERLASIVASSFDAIYAVSLAREVSDVIIQTWNRGAEQLYGYAAHEIIGKPITTILPADRQNEEREIVTRLWQGELVEPHETKRRTKDGREIDVFVTASPLKDATGRIVAVSKIARDITARKRADAALRESEEQLRTLADNIAQFVWMADEQGSMFWYNKRWYEYTGTTLEDVQGWGWTKVHHPEHVDRVVARIRTSFDSGEPWEDIFPLRGKDGQYRWFLSRAQPIRDAAGRVVRWLGTNTDVTEQRAAEESLRHGALHDGLTDLPNRAYFVERVAQAFARMRRDPDYRIAVLLLDCDGFKAVNDSLGHAAGDRFLMEIATRLRSSVRPGDAVARLGGDEFTVLLEDVTGAIDVEQAARRIQNGFVAPVTLEGRDIVATASIGAALSGPDHTQPLDLLRDADLAMYHAKQQGRGRYQLFDIALRDSAKARLDLETDLRTALERQEFRLVFQPIVELESGGLWGFEALLRWHHPKRGAVTPADFIGLAEQTGLTVPIGRWVLREVCRYARSWAEASSAPVRISVNLFEKHYGHPEIVEDVRTAIQDSGVVPSCVALEIADGFLMQHVAASKLVLQRLRDVGVDVYMDDFGTASSSLAYLSQFPIQGIKVNRSLVHRVGGRRIDLDIVRSIVDLSKSLGQRLIAVGIETVAQRERLIAFGCELGQGHLLAKPLEPKAATTLLASTPQPDRRTALTSRAS